MFCCRPSKPLRPVAEDEEATKHSREREAFKSYLNGTACNAERKLLAQYFKHVERDAATLRERWEARHEPPRVFVSSPEKSVEGDLVMVWLMGLCCKQPWRFKQGFDWAGSGNSYTAEKQMWGGVKLYDASVDAKRWDKIFKAPAAHQDSLSKKWRNCMQAGDEAGADAIVQNKIAPILVTTEWCVCTPCLHCLAPRLGITLCAVGW